MKKEFLAGMKDGIPIFLGYFFVSFGFGILAVSSGLPPWVAVVISASNLTSAGQVAGVGVIAAAGSYIEMILTQLLINCRYCLMGLSLSQNLSSEFNFVRRAIVSYGITDEIFGVAISKKDPIKPRYMYGLIMVSTIGWVSGTFLGSVCGQIFPERLTTALGILLYGMFIAVIVPPVRESLANLAVILIASAISCVLYFGMPQISAGFQIIISAVIAAIIMAVVAPIKIDADETTKEGSAS